MTPAPAGSRITVISQVAGGSRADILAAGSFAVDGDGYLHLYAGSSTATDASPLATFAPGWTAVFTAGSVSGG
jgi:hypothetical protein